MRQGFGAAALGDVAHGAGVDAVLHDGGVFGGGDDDDRRGRRQGAHGLEQADARLPLEFEIEQAQFRGGMLTEPGDRLPGVAGFMHAGIRALDFEKQTQPCPEQGVIVDQQNVHSGMSRLDGLGTGGWRDGGERTLVAPRTPANWLCILGAQRSALHPSFGGWGDLAPV